MLKDSVANMRFLQVGSEALIGPDTRTSFPSRDQQHPRIRTSTSKCADEVSMPRFLLRTRCEMARTQVTAEILHVGAKEHDPLLFECHLLDSLWAHNASLSKSEARSSLSLTRSALMLDGLPRPNSRKSTALREPGSCEYRGHEPSCFDLRPFSSLGIVSRP